MGQAGTPRRQPAQGILQSEESASYGIPYGKINCVLRLSAYTDCIPLQIRYNCSPFYIYTYTRHTHIKQIVSSLHLFSIYSSRDHFIIHVKKRTLFKANSRPFVASRWVRGSPMVVAQSLCMLSVRQTGNLVLCSCGPDSSAASSLRTLWNLNHTRISFSSNNDHYFSEQTVKGASERLGGVGWIGGSRIHLGLPYPSPTGWLCPSSWWCPCIYSCELSCQGWSVHKEGGGHNTAEASGGSHPVTSRWSPEASGLASAPFTSGTSCHGPQRS